jgi:hypothetical protein
MSIAPVSRCWVELYDAKGECIDQFRVADPIEGMGWLHEQAKRMGGFDWVNASCWLQVNPDVATHEQWTMEIK